MYNFGVVFFLYAFFATEITVSSSDVGHKGSARLQKNCGKDQFFHNQTAACYYASNSLAAFTQNVSNPCGELMYFYQESDLSPYGVCDCINFDECRFRVDFNRPVLSWPGSNRCYFAYDQGPCRTGQWLVMNWKTFQSECQTNPCADKPLIKTVTEHFIEKPEIDVFWFTKKGTCYQSNTQAYCKEGEFISFFRTHPVPSCRSISSGFGCGSVGTTATLPCPQGHKRVGDACSPLADFQ